MIKTHLAATGADRSMKRSHPQMIQIPDTHVTVKHDNRKDRKIDILNKVFYYKLTKFITLISVGLVPDVKFFNSREFHTIILLFSVNNKK